MKRRVADLENEATAAPPARTRRSASAPADTNGRAIVSRPRGPRTIEDVEAEYAAARDKWIKAMHKAGSGRPADMAALGLAQEAYEVAAAERERWRRGERVAIPVEPEHRQADLSRVVAQELQWREVRSHHEAQGLFGRIRRRFGGR